MTHDPQAQPFAALESRLRDAQLFVLLTPESATSGRIALMTSAAGGIENLVQAYTSRVRPGYVYGEMDWQAIVDMVDNAPVLAGIHIINDRDDWVIIRRSDLGLV